MPRMASSSRLYSCLIALLYLNCTPLNAAGDQSSTGAQQPSASKAENPSICVVVRTYWGHGGSTPLLRRQGLRKLLQSLQRQHNPNWEAVLVAMDSQPFRDLHHILQDLDDDRIWVYAEWIGREFTPKMQGVWTQGYHEKLYNLTDDAIRACPRNTDWVVVTNGDNYYADTFFDRISEGNEAELLAFDFYSRYQRSTAVPCERFGQQEGAPVCKRNKLRWCQTDLGANVMRWPKLVAEDRRFGALAPMAPHLSAEHFDGIMAQVLGAAWRVQFVRECLYEHSPTPQQCARLGGVWDDSETSQSKIGGSCLNSWQASKRLKDGHGSIEEVGIGLSHDPYLRGFQDSSEPAVTTMRCLRQTNVTKQHYEMMTFFGETCAEDVDLLAFNDTAYQAVAEQVRKELEEAALAEQRAMVQAGRPQPPGPPNRTRDDVTFVPKFRERIDQPPPKVPAGLVQS